MSNTLSDGCIYGSYLYIACILFIWSISPSYNICIPNGKIRSKLFSCSLMRCVMDPSPKEVSYPNFILIRPQPDPWSAPVYSTGWGRRHTGAYIDIRQETQPLDIFTRFKLMSPKSKTSINIKSLDICCGTFDSWCGCSVCQGNHMSVKASNFHGMEVTCSRPRIPGKDACILGSGGTAYVELIPPSKEASFPIGSMIGYVLTARRMNCTTWTSLGKLFSVKLCSYFGANAISWCLWGQPQVTILRGAA